MGNRCLTLLVAAPRWLGGFAMAGSFCILWTMLGAKPAAAITIMGQGVESCGSWLQGRADGPNGDLQWVLGYLSGVARWTGKDSLKATDGVGVWYWIDDYCRSHAPSKLQEALDAFVDQRASAN